MTTAFHYQHIKSIYGPRGYTIKRNQQVHPRVKKFFATASNSSHSKIVAVDVINDPIEIVQYGELYTMFRSSHMPVDIVVLANFTPVGATFISNAKRSGIGIIAVENERASLISEPNYDSLIVSDINHRALECIESINLASTKYGFCLFKDLKVVSRCFKEITAIPTTPEDANGLLLRLGTVLDEIDMVKLQKALGRTDIPGSLNNLIPFLRQIGKPVPNSIQDLKDIYTARSTRFPTHSNPKAYKGAVRSLTGKSNPTEDELCWSCLNKFLNGLIELRDALK